MPKKKYIYFNKKPLKNGINQQEEDINYFKYPEYSEIIGKKYGLSGKAIEIAFRQYFEAMKYFGLTQIINKDKLRKQIKTFELFYCYNLSSADVIGEANIIFNEINVKNSLKVGNYGVLFHEFNHLISIDNRTLQRWKYNRDENILSTGYSISTIIEKEIKGEKKTKKNELAFNDEETLNKKFIFINEYNNFNEGVTEFLTSLQISFLNKKSIVIEAYPLETSFAHALYLICGNALFEGYFGKGDFSAISDVFGDKLDVNTIKNFAKVITNNSNNDSVSFLIQTYYDIQSALIDLLSYKVCCDIKKNINEFKNYDIIKKVVLKCFGEFSKTLYFENSKKSLLNYNRDSIFYKLTNNFYNVMADIKDFIVENNIEISLPKNDILKEKMYEIYDFFEYCNDCQYGLIDYGIKPINVVDFINSNNINLNEYNYSNYIRSKNNFDKVSEMKDREKYEKIINRINKHANYESKQQNKIISDERSI